MLIDFDEILVKNFYLNYFKFSFLKFSFGKLIPPLKTI